MGILDGIRAKAFGLVEGAPGKLGDLARRANDALGRPLASDEELADRAAFVTQTTAKATYGASTRASGTAAPTAGEPAPVIVYHMNKTRRDALRLTEILDEAKVPYKVFDIQEDAAAQMAVRRDSRGFRLPVVFIAGEPIGGRTELTNMATSGELKKKVFG